MNVILNPDTPLFRHRYRIQSSRAPRWNYTANGSYFITICTHDRYPWFGYIRNGIMCVSDIGAIIDDEWRKTGCIRPYVTLDRYIIMPDHFHGIITIHQNPGTNPGANPNHHHEWQPGCLGAIINQFKSACTKRIWKNGHDGFGWQPRFHDSIIRDNDAIEKIRMYITNNPAQSNYT